MVVVLEPKAQELLDDLPYFYSDEPHTQAVLRAVGGEIAHLLDQAERIRFTAVPSQADDSFGFLSLWERLLALPVAPVGISEAGRRNAVLAQLRKRTSGSGADWVAAISQSLGTENWTHFEDGYTVIITMPFSQPTYASRQTENLARQITPAHIRLEFVYGQGFVIGESLIGIDVL